MGQRRSSLGIGGCVIPIIGVIFGTLSFLLESGVLFFFCLGLGIIIFFWSKSDSKRAQLKTETKNTKLRQNLKGNKAFLQKKNKLFEKSKLDDIEFLESLVSDLDESSSFKIDLKSDGRVNIYGLLFYKKSFKSNYKKEGKFNNYEDAIKYLRKDDDS